jgi:hypothetical protein
MSRILCSKHLLLHNVFRIEKCQRKKNNLPVRRNSCSLLLFLLITICVFTKEFRNKTAERWRLARLRLLKCMRSM